MVMLWAGREAGPGSRMLLTDGQGGRLHGLQQRHQGGMCKSPAGFSPGMSVPGPLIPLCAPFPPTGALEIGQALPIHTGRYTCTARNAAGMAHKHVVLTVRGERPRAGQLWPWRQGSRWRARGFSGRKDSACLCPPFRGFRKPLFPLEASVSGAQTPLGWRCPQGPLPPCSFAASPVVKPLPSVVWAVAKKEVLLPCEASGLPRPSITWQKEGLSVPVGKSPLGVLLPVPGPPTPAGRSGKPMPCPEAWHPPVFPHQPRALHSA